MMLGESFVTSWQLLVYNYCLQPPCDVVLCCLFNGETMVGSLHAAMMMLVVYGSRWLRSESLLSYH